MRTTLLKMFLSGEIHRTFRTICHGAWIQPRPAPTSDQDQQHQQQIPSTTTSNTPADSLLDAGSLVPIDPTFEDASCIQSIKVVQLSHSNEAGHLSTLEIQPSKGFAGVNIRRYLMSAGHPMVGDSGNTRPLKANRNKGLMTALIKMEFLHPTKQGETVIVTMEEPGKFEQLRIREQKARQKRKADEKEELRRGGLEETVGENYDRNADLPIAYMIGEKVRTNNSLLVLNSCGPYSMGSLPLNTLIANCHPPFLYISGILWSTIQGLACNPDPPIEH